MKTEMEESMKTLVAYFSCSGVTKKVAQSIAEILSGNLYEIKPKVPYSSADLNWNDPNSRSSLEMKNKTSRPAIATDIENMELYDVIFIGFPIWWYLAPTVINTFLESYDFKGKTIVPFATSGGSSAGETNKYLQVSCSNGVNWYPTTILNGCSLAKLTKWIDDLNL